MAHRAGVFAAFALLVHHPGQHPDRQRRLLVFVDQADDLHQGSGDPARQHHKGDQRAGGQLRLQHQCRTASDHADLHQLFQKTRRGPRQRADGTDIPLPPQRRRQIILPYPAAQGFQHQRLDRAHVVQRLGQVGLTRALGRIQSVQATAEGRQQRADTTGNRQRKAQHQRGQSPAQHHQDTEQQRQKRSIQQSLEQSPGQKGANFLGLLHVPRQHACGGGLKHRQRQRQQMRKGPCPDDRIDARPGNLHQPLPHKGKSGVKACQHHIDHHDGGQRVPRLMRDHPVDQHLKQQGQGKADQVADHHRHRNPRQQPRLRPHGRHEPRQAKGRCLGPGGGAFLHQQDLACPHRRKLRHGNGLDAQRLLGGVEDGRDLGTVLNHHHDQDDPGPVAARDQRRVSGAKGGGGLDSAALQQAALQPRPAQRCRDRGQHVAIGQLRQILGPQRLAMMGRDQEGRAQRGQLMFAQRQFPGKSGVRNRHAGP